jgi:hypothetical protein
MLQRQRLARMVVEVARTRDYALTRLRELFRLAISA